MNYFDVYKTDSPIVKMQFGGKYSYDPNDPKSIEAFQRLAASKGKYTKAIDGKDGPGTRAALEALNSESDVSWTQRAKEIGGKIVDASIPVKRFWNSLVVNSPGLTALTEGASGLYHKGLNAVIDPEEHPELNKALSLRRPERNNSNISPIQNEIYQSLGNYAIDKGYKSIDTSLINRWYKDVGQHNDTWNTFLSDEDKKDWRYSNNKIDLLKKNFNPIERVMNTVGRASITEENGEYYITDLYDHNKKTYVSKEWANNKNATNPTYGKIVHTLQNVHLSDEDPDWQKQSTRIRINR